MIEDVVALVRLASAAVMRVYESADVGVEYKGPDDPVTRADKEANAILVEGLKKILDVPVVAEESDAGSYAGWQASDAAWFVDPVDGTREFVERNGEFAVMVGLAREGRSVLGVVCRPANGRVLAAAEGKGAWDGDRRLVVSTCADLKTARIVASRSRPSPRLAEILARAGAPAPQPIGSAGIKGALVAAGEVDAYVHMERAGYRWDACACDVIVREAGGRFTDIRGADYDYKAASLANDGGVLVTNGRLHDALLRELAR